MEKYSDKEQHWRGLLFLQLQEIITRGGSSISATWCNCVEQRKGKYTWSIYFIFRYPWKCSIFTPIHLNTQSRPSHFFFLTNSLMDRLAAHRNCCYSRISSQVSHYTHTASSDKSCFFHFSRCLYFCEQSAYFLVHKTALFLSVFSSVNISREIIVCQELNY